MPRSAIYALLALLFVVGVAALVVRLRQTSYYRVRFGDAADRATAVRELADKPKESAVPSLLRALDDPDAKVRQQAIHALARFRATEAMASCRGMLAGDKEPTVRSTAAAFLGEVQSPLNGPALVEALGDTDERVRVAVVTSLGKLDWQESAGDLMGRLEDPSEMVRETAVIALGKLKAQVAVPALIEMLDQEDEVPASRIREALTAITGKNFGIDAEPWRSWYQSTHRERKP